MSETDYSEFFLFYINFFGVNLYASQDDAVLDTHTLSYILATVCGIFCCLLYCVYKCARFRIKVHTKEYEKIKDKNFRDIYCDTPILMINIIQINVLLIFVYLLIEILFFSVGENYQEWFTNS